MFDMSFDGFMSPDKGRFEIASYLWKSSRANSFNNWLFVGLSSRGRLDKI